MEEVQNKIEAPILTDITTALLNEVVKTEMTMHYEQVKAWKWMQQFPPKGVLVHKEILKGIHKDRYLSIDELTFSIYIKPMRSGNFFTRLGTGLQFIFGRKVSLNKNFSYEICDKNDNNAQPLHLKIKRHDKGKFIATRVPPTEINLENKEEQREKIE